MALIESFALPNGNMNPKRFRKILRSEVSYSVRLLAQRATPMIAATMPISSSTPIAADPIIATIVGMMTPNIQNGIITPRPIRRNNEIPRPTPGTRELDPTIIKGATYRPNLSTIRSRPSIRPRTKYQSRPAKFHPAKPLCSLSLPGAPWPATPPAATPTVKDTHPLSPTSHISDTPTCGLQYGP